MFILFACAAAKFRDFLKILQNLHREMWQRFSAFQTAFGQRRRIIFDWEKHLRCRNLFGILPRKPANNSANLDLFLFMDAIYCKRIFIFIWPIALLLADEKDKDKDRDGDRDRDRGKVPRQEREAVQQLRPLQAWSASPPGRVLPSPAGEDVCNNHAPKYSLCAPKSW